MSIRITITPKPLQIFHERTESLLCESVWRRGLCGQTRMPVIPLKLHVVDMRLTRNDWKFNQIYAHLNDFFQWGNGTTNLPKEKQVSAQGLPLTFQVDVFYFSQVTLNFSRFVSERSWKSFLFFLSNGAEARCELKQTQGCGHCSISHTEQVPWLFTNMLPHLEDQMQEHSAGNWQSNLSFSESFKFFPHRLFTHSISLYFSIFTSISFIDFRLKKMWTKHDDMRHFTLQKVGKKQSVSLAKLLNIFQIKKVSYSLFIPDNLNHISVVF